MLHRYQIVDAFSEVPLLGNPVAVVFQAGDLAARKMQMIAAELQLSEVVFIVSSTDSDLVDVRIFTPVNELPFAGHPLIGAARAYLDHANRDEATFRTKVGTVKMRRNEGDSSEVEIEHPAPHPVDFSTTDYVLEALGLEDAATPMILYDAGARHLLVHCATTQTLYGLTPDLLKLATLDNMAVNCFAVADGVIHNRMFSPAYGVNEDAATGSACAPLAMFALSRGLVANAERVVIVQGRRLGKACTMAVDVSSVGNKGIAVLSGKTCFVATGQLLV